MSKSWIDVKDAMNCHIDNGTDNYAYLIVSPDAWSDLRLDNGHEWMDHNTLPVDTYMGLTVAVVRGAENLLEVR